MNKKGNIKVESENIFPIIKRWLYSDKDIFLRELVSNASDAIKKLEHLISMGEFELEGFKGRIDIKIDKENKTLKITDNGLGMNANEVEKYITQIAFSGAEDFINKYKDKTGEDSGIIGHFGLGFYSAFMVSDSVEIDTLSFEKNAKPVHWVSDGSSSYEISDGKKETPGTTITLNISESEKEFLEEDQISKILFKYCKFMPYEIYLNSENKEDEKPFNNVNPLYLKAPRECKKEEYEEFYRETFMDFNPPLFWIHLNVDYPFRLKGILYFPHQSSKVEVMPGEIKLYNNQVYIADNIKEVVPEFLMLLKGVIDCPDLPLNVSRSFLQNDRDVAKISNHITKKVSDKLHSVFNENREEYENYFDDIAPFIKFGSIKEQKFFERVSDILLFKTINGEYKTIKEYLGEDKEKVYYVTNESIQAQYIKLFKDNGMDAVILNHAIDTHFISFMEYKNPKVKFLRIDSDVSDEIKDENNNLSSEKIEDIKEKFKQSVSNDKLLIEVNPLKTKNVPAIITLSESERRMKDMSAIYGDMGAMFANLEDKITIILNSNNSIIKSIPNLDEKLLSPVCNQVYNLALISNKQLSAEETVKFIESSTNILNLTINNK